MGTGIEGTDISTIVWKHLVHNNTVITGYPTKTFQNEEALLNTESPSMKHAYVKYTDGSDQLHQLTCNETVQDHILYPSGGDLYFSQSQQDVIDGREQDSSGFWSDPTKRRLAMSGIIVGGGVAIGLTIKGVAALKAAGGLKAFSAASPVWAAAGYAAVAVAVYVAIDFAYELAQQIMEENTTTLRGQLVKADGTMWSQCTYDHVDMLWKYDSSESQARTPIISESYRGSGTRLYMVSLETGSNYYTDYMLLNQNQDKPIIINLCDSKHWPADDQTCVARTEKCQLHPYSASQGRHVISDGVYTGAPIGLNVAALCPQWDGEKFTYPSNSELPRMYDGNANPLLSDINEDFAEQLKQTNQLIAKPECAFECTNNGWKVTANGNGFCNAAKGYVWDPDREACVDKKAECADDLCKATGGTMNESGACMCGTTKCDSAYTSNGNTYYYCGPKKDKYGVNDTYCNPTKGGYWTTTPDKIMSAVSDMDATFNRLCSTSNAMSDANDPQTDIPTLVANLSKIESEFGLSKWRTAEGKFNYARLASDATAGIVLGTTGALVTAHVVKKKQVEDGFESLGCTVGGQHVGDWGDVFRIDGK